MPLPGQQPISTTRICQLAYTPACELLAPRENSDLIKVSSKAGNLLSAFWDERTQQLHSNLFLISPARCFRRLSSKMWKIKRLNANVEAPPSDQLSEAASKVQALRDEAKKRAERFGTEYKEPNIIASGVLSKTEWQRLTQQQGAGEVTGFDLSAPEQVAKRQARASRFGVAEFDYEKERLLAAGLSEEAIKLRKERRERAAKFGITDPIDIEVAKAAYSALGGVGDDMDQDSTAAAGDAAAGEGTSVAQPRPEVIHMRAYQYLPAASADIFAFFSPIRPSFVEWLNAIAVNVIFEDEGTAKRALERFSEAIPTAAGVTPVDPSWRVCLKPMVKQFTDKYAPKGAETTVYLRTATTLDTKERAARTAGPKTHGTYSQGGIFSKQAVRQDLQQQQQQQQGQYVHDTRSMFNYNDPIDTSAAADDSTTTKLAHRITSAYSGIAAHLAAASEDLSHKPMRSPPPVAGAGAPSSSSAAAAPRVDYTAPIDEDVLTSMKITVDFAINRNSSAKARGKSQQQQQPQSQLQVQRQSRNDGAAAPGSWAAAGSQQAGAGPVKARGRGRKVFRDFGAGSGAAEGGNGSAGPAVGSRRRRGDDDDDDEDMRREAAEADAYEAAAAGGASDAAGSAAGFASSAASVAPTASAQDASGTEAAAAALNAVTDDQL